MTRHEHYKNKREAEAVENERETDTERVECKRALYGLSMTSPTLLYPRNQSGSYASQSTLPVRTKALCHWSQETLLVSLFKIDNF
jgi:hypothetical protein